MSAPYTIRRTNAGWQVTWHRFNNETTLHETCHHAEQSAERVYGSPLAYLKACAALDNAIAKATAS